MKLSELADSLGLSQTTVSRALNGYPEVSEATRQRVVAAARQHNYRPNTRARSLATGRAMAIGHVIPMSSQHEMVNPVFADFITGASETYTLAGYDFLMSVVGDTDEASVYRELRSRKSVDGVIVHGPRLNDPRVHLLSELGLPFVVHGRASETATGYSWLDVNNRRAFEEATHYLLGLGHRRIALVNGLEVLDFARRRKVGYCAALAEAGIAPDRTLMASGEMTEGFGHRTAERLTRLADPPTAYLASSMTTALGIRRAVEEAGLVLGRDVSLITHDDELSYLRNGDEAPIFTATRSSVRTAGRRAARMLLDLIAQPERGPIQQLMEAELVVGPSTGPAPH